MSLTGLPLLLARRGKAGFKVEVARRVQVDAAHLPYNQDVLALLQRARADGHELILASASERSWVEAVARHLGIFDRVIGTDGEGNAKGRAKLARLQAVLGDRPFTYVADSPADLPLWNAAASAHVVSRSRGLPRRIELPADRVHHLALPSRRRALVRALRPHQWLKNLLVFVPLALSHQFFDAQRLLGAALSFLALSLAAAAFYVINDMLDLASDRRHPQKRHRVFAAGALGVPEGLALAAACLAASLALSILLLPPGFLAIVLSYCAVTFAYSLYLKRLLIVDVIVLALFYTIRVLAGGVASGVEVSPWLLTFSTFFFLSLAMVKRYVELRALEGTAELKSHGRGYEVGDVPMVMTSGLSSGFLSVLVFFIYVAESPAAATLYRNSVYLWLIGPLLIFWLLRIWFLARRGEVDSDPVLFALKDGTSRLTAAAVVALIALGTGL